MKRILVPIDFADCSKKALEVALQLAGHECAEVEVMHVWYVADFAAPDLPIAVIRACPTPVLVVNERYASRGQGGSSA
jgi:nucleotide-binding universal stress UspA family protein